MKFFKSHAIKYKGYKVIFVPDKFDDIRADAFKGISPEYIIFSENTQIIRNYAFSGLNECNIFLPDSVTEIEPTAFEDLGSDVVIYCNQGSFADRVCSESGVNVSYDELDIAALREEQERMLLKPEPVQRIEEMPVIELEEPKVIPEMPENDDLLPDADEASEIGKAEEKEEIHENEPISENDVTSESDEADAADDTAEQEDTENHNAVDENYADEAQDEMTDIFQGIPETRMHDIRVVMYDEQNGISESIVSYDALSENIKAHIVDYELYLYCKYDNDNRTTSAISKAEFDFLTTQGKNEPEPPEVTALKCPFCQEKIGEGDVYCAMCGRKIKNIINCPRCNEPNDADDNFCAYCGNRL